MTLLPMSPSPSRCSSDRDNPCHSVQHWITERLTLLKSARNLMPGVGRPPGTQLACCGLQSSCPCRASCPGGGSSRVLPSRISASFPWQEPCLLLEPLSCSWAGARDGAPEAHVGRHTHKVTGSTHGSDPQVAFSLLSFSPEPSLCKRSSI